MGMTMNQAKLKALAAELAKDLKTPEDLSALTSQFTKITVEASLNAELEHHLGYIPATHIKVAIHAIAGMVTARKSSKVIHGTIEIDTPRDRNASFEPELVAKGQTRITSNDTIGNNMPYNISSQHR